MSNSIIIMGPNDLAPYREAWDQLFDRVVREPSTSYEWTNALWKNHDKLFSIFFLIIIKKNDDITGILPMIAREDRLLGRKLVTVSPVSELYNTHSDWLVIDYSDEIVSEVISKLLQLPFKWDLFRMTKLVDNNPLIEGLVKALKRTKLRHQLRQEPPSFYLPLDATMKQYLDKRSGKFRNYLKRMQKKLAAKGKLCFKKTGIELNVERAYQALLEVERNSWKHEHGTAISNAKRKTGFFRDFCQEAFSRSHLHLLFLYVDSTPVAYDMGFIHDDRYSYLKTSFDNRFKPASPATILRAKLIELLIADGIKTFDFPGEPYIWEKQWTDEFRWHTSLLMYNNTLPAMTYKTISVVKGILDKNRKPDTGDGIDYFDPKALKNPKK